MLRTIRIALLLGLLTAGFIGIGVHAATSTIEVLHADGTVNPVLASYIDRGIDQAEEEDAVAVVIQMDTPGGLDDSMRDIIQRIVSAEVPVVVYVSPSGARAASAGTFITMAGHVAAMAPTTSIGAASPVAIGSEGEEVEMSETMEAKVVNDAVTLIKGLAATHGRNVEWAEQAVREGIAATEQEALELNVIDIVATDLDDLVLQLDGRQVTMHDGEVITLHTEGAMPNNIEMSTVEDLLYTVSNPSIAFILVSLGMLGVFIELSNPGLIVPGVVGGICLILGFYSLGMLPINYAGLALLGIGFGLFAAEIFTPGFGIFTAGGVACLVIGSIILSAGGPAYMQISTPVIVGVAVSASAVSAFIISRVVRAHRRQAATGKEELIGKTALVKVALEPEGTVFFKGERWTAVSEEGRVKPGEEVTITKVDGLKLWVTKKNK